MNRALAIAQVLLCATAFADANIVVDGNNADWAATTSCFNEPTGDVTGGIDLNRSCVENNNSSGDVGSLFFLFQNANATQSLRGNSFGFQYDLNQDGVFDGNDEIWYVTIPATGNTITTLTVLDAASWQQIRSYNTTANCGGSVTSNGWRATWVNNVVELAISYGCLGWSFGNDNRYIQVGAYQPLDTSPAGWYDGNAGTVTPPGTPSNVLQFTIASGPKRNTLTWTNPAAHQGVLIIRRTGSAVTATPTNGTEYAAGANMGNGQTVVYADGMGNNSVVSTVSTWTDTNVTEPSNTDVRTRYFYKVFNHHQARTYSNGNVPTTAGLFGEPTRVTRPATWNGPYWCFSTGLASYVQPTQRRGIGVYAPGNSSAVIGNNTVPASQSLDGLERFRPRAVSAAIQDRFTVTSAGGVNGIFTGDQSGRVYAFDSDTGAPIPGWTNNGVTPLTGASSIQTTPVFQARAFSSAAAQAVMPSDLVFIATRNSSATNNRIYALRADTGAVVWVGPTNSAGVQQNMDIVAGVPWVEYDATGINRLWVGSRSNNNTQPSLWVLDSLTGRIIKTFNIPAGAVAGGVDLPIFRDNTLKQMVLVDNNGIIRAYSLATLTEVWTANLGGSPASFPYTVGGTFFITRKRTSGAETGRLYRYQVVNNVASVMTGWPRQIPDPSYPTIDFTAGQQRVYVGSSDGQVYSVDINNQNLKVIRVGAAGQQLGTPGIDTSAGRLHVYGAEGRVCAFKMPFN